MTTYAGGSGSPQIALHRVGDPKLYASPEEHASLREMFDLLRKGNSCPRLRNRAHGATYRGRQVGTFGYTASYRFFPGKNLGAWGNAGAMLTDGGQLAHLPA
jgi:hypothetical protein